ncbi:MAG: PocR ligand-binding domain-containing protein [Acidobacteriaceae bacterium]
MKNPTTVLTGTLKQEFQTDLELFKHFLLLINNAGPIRNVELMWNEELDPTKPKYKNRVGTEDAIVQLLPVAGSDPTRKSPSTLFCDLVHGFGTHEEATCAHSDVPAQQRCKATGCSQIYACHVGLTDIAVPVICDGEYLGTLFSGQVLTSPPTPRGFEIVRRTLAGQDHIDFAKLEAAYFGVPVVKPSELAEMTRLLELFARYISNSWKRLKIMSEMQRNQDRQVALDRRELAAILLSGELGERKEIEELSRRAGLHRLPDVVIVMKLQHSGAQVDSRKRISDQITLTRLSHVVEDLCQGWPNTLATVVRPGEICILTSQDVRNSGHGRISLQERSETILAAVNSHAGVSARIGISAPHLHIVELVQAYQEANVALESNTVSLAFFSEPVKEKRQPIELLEYLLKAIRQGSDVPAATRQYLASTMQLGKGHGELQQSRALLTWAIEHLALEVVVIESEVHEVNAAKKRAIKGVLNAATVFAAGEAFRRFVDLLAQRVASAFSQREQKLVRMVHRIVEEKGAAQITIEDIARHLHLSSGHLSRVFRRTTGETLEVYLIKQRVELAKRALLDPRLNVGEVAERCGFCNPAYFASVFKRYVQCTPREYARRPHLWTAAPAEPVPTASDALLTNFSS